MTEKKGKRAVIINNIKSSSIEQAIFILRTPVYDNSEELGGGIVEEAQAIINSYISKIEKRHSRNNKRTLKLLTFIAGALCLSAIVIMFCLKF